MQWKSDQFEASLDRQARFGLENCIGANDCMLVCPVNRLEINQNELDTVLTTGVWTERVQAFVTECIQCGDCTLACPANVPRDQMMLKLKSILPRLPLKWRLYYQLKGRQDQSWLISLYDLAARRIAGSLGKYVDKPQLDQKSTLFYFGCYVFSPSGAPAATLKLADRLGLDYEVLAGVRSCCGYPQYLTGRMGYGQGMLEHLGELVNQVQPDTIISGCAECYMALLRLKKKTGAAWTPLTTTEWLLGSADQLTWRKLDARLGVHDSCHITKKAGKPEPVRALLARMADVVELYDSPAQCTCCGYYNIHVNHDLSHKLHEQKLEVLKERQVQGMAVECVTCWESYNKTFKAAQMPLWDLMVAAEQATRPEGE